MTAENKLPLTSFDVTAEVLAKLREIAPQVFTEGGVDFDKLKATLGENIVSKDERYGLSWAGKSEAFRNVQIPSVGTLLPQAEESIDFDTSENLIIEGDNLEALKLLQKSYHGKVKMIYIDPPYNTGNEFIYPDNYHEGLDDYLKYSGQVTESGQRASSETDTSGRYHSKWLSMMYPRLFLARNLLNEDGVIFVSVDDHEVHNLRLLLNEVFGAENSMTQKAGTALIWNKQHSQQQGLFKRYHEYVLVYAKNVENLKHIRGGEGFIDAGALKKISRSNPASEFTFQAGVRFDAPDGKVLTGTFGDSEKVTVVRGSLIAKDGKTAEEVTLSAGWTQKDQMTSFFTGQPTFDTKGQKVVEFYFSSTGKLKCIKERETITPSTILPPYGMVSESTEALRQLMGESIFDNPKPVNMIKDFVTWFANDEDIVLDFFAGSGTTAQAVLEKNAEDNGARRFILIQLPEKITHASYKTIADVTRERVRRAIQKLNIDMPNDDLDRGFKALKLTSSNFKIWNADTTSTNAEAIGEQLRLYADNVEQERTQQDILYELVLKSGIPLSAKVEHIEVAGKPVYSIAQGQLLICLESEISQAVLRGMIALTPVQMVCLDRAFGGNDQMKTNTVLEAKSQDVTFRTV